MLKVGDVVTHWNYGVGTVKNGDPWKHQVPVEWEHDYTNVVLVEFNILTPTGNWRKEWVLRDDLKENN